MRVHPGVRALALVGLGLLCLWLWRIQGHFYDAYQWREVSHPQRCQTVTFDWTPERPLGAFLVQEGPLKGALLFARTNARAEELAQQPNLSFVVWHPETGPARQVSSKEVDLQSLTNARTGQDLCATDQSSFVQCGNVRYSVPPPQWWMMGTHTIWPLSTQDGRYALEVSQDALTLAGGGFFFSLNDLISSYLGVFRLDVYTREQPNVPRLSIVGRYAGQEFHQDSFARSAQWLANRYIFFRAEMQRPTYCLCDMEKQ